MIQHAFAIYKKIEDGRVVLDTLSTIECVSVKPYMSTRDLADRIEYDSTCIPLLKSPVIINIYRFFQF